MAEEEQKPLMEQEETPVGKSDTKKDGTRVFKKTSPNGKITVYVGRRDFVDHVTDVDPIDGVVLVDSTYFNKESKKDRKVFAQVLVGFRYGRDDLDLLGVNFRRDLVDERIQVYPPPDPSKPQLLTLLQVRLLKKLGRNAYPFTFTLRKGLPSSVSLQASHGGNEGDKPCGVDFILRCYIAKSVEDRIEKRNSVRLSVKKISVAPIQQTERPTAELTKEFMLSSHPVLLEANLDKGTYYHGEPIKVNVSITNRSSKTIRRIKISVRQIATICLYTHSQFKGVVADVESSEGFPLSTGSSLQRTYEVTPLLKDNRDKKGLAVDGQIKHEDTCLASSTILPPGTQDTKEVRENLGILVNYCVKVRCIVAFGSDLALKLPFTLTHSQPKERVISQLVTLPPRPLPSSSAGTTSDEGKETKAAGPEASAAGDEVEDKDKAAEAAAAADEVRSVHDIIDHNLISFDTDEPNSGDDQDFVFEEFVRLRVAGVDEPGANETEA